MLSCVEARDHHQVSVSITLHLIFVTESLTEPGAPWFKPDWLTSDTFRSTCSLLPLHRAVVTP